MVTNNGEQPAVGVNTALTIGFAKIVALALAVSLHPLALVVIN
jgi:hypothetical protein